jgi:endonuclease YncB( thermonuclease family)
MLALACLAATNSLPMPPISTAAVCPATVMAVHDGDTLTVAVPGPRPYVGPVRLQNVFALELATPGGKKAQEHLLSILPVGSKVRVQFFYTREGSGIESLCRPIANLWLESSGLHVNTAQTEWLKAHGYWGGTGR